MLDWIDAVPAVAGEISTAIGMFLIAVALFSVLGCILVGPVALLVKAVASEAFGNRPRMAHASMLRGLLVGIGTVVVYCLLHAFSATRWIFEPLGIGLWEIGALVVLWAGAPLVDYLFVVRGPWPRSNIAATIGFLVLSNLWVPWAGFLMRCFDGMTDGTPCYIAPSADTLLADPAPCAATVPD